MARAAAPEDGDLRTGFEVALLVEDAVVRQQPLAVDGGDLAAFTDEARVVEPAVSASGAPTSVVMPVAACATSRVVCAAARTKAGRSRRSSGG